MKLPGRGFLSQTVPNLMEFGGAVRVRRVDRKTKQKRRSKAVYAPRPFMGPALDQERDNIPEAFRGVLNG